MARILITVNRVLFTNAGIEAGCGRARFQATVLSAGTLNTLGDPQRLFDYRRESAFTLDWSIELDSAATNEARFRLDVVDEALNRLAKFEWTLQTPWRQFEHEILSVANAHLVWSVLLEASGRYRVHDPNTVFTSREHRGAVNYTTVSGRRRSIRMEICPVLPVPADKWLPRRPKNMLTAIQSGGPQPLRNNPPGHRIRATDPINIISNPAVIPLLTVPQPPPPPVRHGVIPPPPLSSAEIDEPPLGTPQMITQRTAARIEFTYFWSSDERFTDNDLRLEWSQTGGTGQVQFIKWRDSDPDGSENRGLRVMVHGTRRGPVVLTVRFNGTDLAQYRAVVAPVRRVPCRFNILNARNRRSRPIATPAHADAHRRIANRFLRQVGFELAPDSDPNIAPAFGGWVATTGVPGVFTVRVEARLTRNVSDTTCEESIAVNKRPGVLSFAYIHSYDDAGTDGAAANWPDSALGNRAAALITDNGSPSNSWIQPSGVDPDGAAGAVNMKIISGIPNASDPNLHGMVVTNGCGNAPGGADAMYYGRVIAHEVGHMLTLGHRIEVIADATQSAKWNNETLRPHPGGGHPRLVEGAGVLGAGDGMFCDELWHPRLQNVMNFAGHPDLAWDLDILQALAVAQSPIAAGGWCGACGAAPGNCACP